MRDQPTKLAARAARSTIALSGIVVAVLAVLMYQLILRSRCPNQEELLRKGNEAERRVAAKRLLAWACPGSAEALCQSLRDEGVIPRKEYQDPARTVWIAPQTFPDCLDHFAGEALVALDASADREILDFYEKNWAEYDLRGVESILRRRFRSDPRRALGWADQKDVGPYARAAVMKISAKLISPSQRSDFLKALQRALTDESVIVRSTAIREVARFEGEYVPLVEALAAETDFGQQLELLGAMAQMRLPDGECQALLHLERAYLEKSDREILLGRLIHALVHACPRGPQYCRQFLDSEVHLVKIIAAGTLSEIQDPAVREELSLLGLRHSDDEVKSIVIEGLQFAPLRSREISRVLVSLAREGRNTEALLALYGCGLVVGPQVWLEAIHNSNGDDEACTIACRALVRDGHEAGLRAVFERVGDNVASAPIDQGEANADIEWNDSLRWVMEALFRDSDSADERESLPVILRGTRALGAHRGFGIVRMIARLQGESLLERYCRGEAGEDGETSVEMSSILEELYLIGELSGAPSDPWKQWAVKEGYLDCYERWLKRKASTR